MTIHAAFTEELAGSHAAALAPGHLDGRGTVEDEEELLARLPHARQHRARGHLDHARDRGHGLQLLLRTVGEEVHLLQVPDLLVLRKAAGLRAMAQQIAQVPAERAVEHAADEFHGSQSFFGYPSAFSASVISPSTAGSSMVAGMV